MKTADALNQLPPKCKEYLETLKKDVAKVEAFAGKSMWKEYRAVARGYIKGLVDSGVIDDFKPIWIWFTL